MFSGSANHVVPTHGGGTRCDADDAACTSGHRSKRGRVCPMQNRLNAECGRRPNRHRAPTPECGVGRSSPQTRHICNGSKDMVTKNKCLKKKEKYASQTLTSNYKLGRRNHTQQKPHPYRRTSTDSPSSSKHKKRWKLPKRKLAG